MPLSFNIDLRKRVVSAVDEGMHKDEAVKVFKISRRTVYRWLELRDKNSDLSPRSGYQKGHSPKIKDLNEFKAFVEKNSHRTVNQMIALWSEKTGVGMSEQVMGKYLKKIGYTSKKKLLDIPNQTRKNVHYFWKN